MKKKKAVEVSIIIISYNMQKYIWRCLLSIVFQTFRNIEIIVIDNGSKDKTLNILKQFKKVDKRIRIIHLKENIGLPKARNYGVSIARGDYITFIDADDLCNLNFIKMLYMKAHDNDADLVTCNVDTFSKNILVREKHHPEDWYQKQKQTMRIEECPEQLYELAAWAKLLKREFIKDIPYKYVENSLFCEDVPANTSLFLKANRISIINKSLYYYRIRKDSLSHIMGKHQIDDFIYAMRLQDEVVRSNNVQDNKVLVCIFEVRLLLANLLLSRINEYDVNYYFENIFKAFEYVDERYLYNLFGKMEYAKLLFEAIKNRNTSVYTKIRKYYHEGEE